MFGFHARGLASECGGNEVDGKNGSGGVEEVGGGLAAVSPSEC